MLLPISVGGEFLFSHWGEDNNQITLNAMAGIRANLVSHLYLTGKVGLGFDYFDAETGNQEDSRIDIGFKTNVILAWFFM